MKVSVCVPVYNGSRYLRDCLTSVLSQSFGDLELIVCDDGSRDESRDIVSAIRDDRVRFLENPARLGIPGNWNRCLGEAAGEYLCIFHQDDVMEPDNLQRKVSMLDAHPRVGMVHSKVTFMKEDSAPGVADPWVDDTDREAVRTGREYFRELLLRGNRICAPAVVARTALVREQGGFREGLTFTADFELWLRLLVVADVGFLPEPLVRYRWHEGNASHRFTYQDDTDQTLAACLSAIAFYEESTGDRDAGRVMAMAVRGIHGWRTKLAAAYRDLNGTREWGNGLDQDYRETLAWGKDLEKLLRDAQKREREAWQRLEKADARAGEEARARREAENRGRDLEQTLRKAEAYAKKLEACSRETRERLDEALACLNTPSHQLVMRIDRLLRRTPGLHRAAARLLGAGKGKPENPNTKHQIPNKSQSPKPE